MFERRLELCEKEVFTLNGARVGDALRPFAVPVVGTLLPAGCRVDLVQTHGNSNSATADAALAGLRLLAAAGTFVLAEGQSDNTVGWAFTPPEGYRKYSFETDLPEEHRAQDVFSKKSVIGAVLRRKARDVSGKSLSRDELIAKVGELAGELAQAEDLSRWGISHQMFHFLGGVNEVRRLAHELAPGSADSPLVSEDEDAPKAVPQL